MKVKHILQILLLSGILLTLTIVSLWQVQQVSLAQGGGEITMSKTLNRAGNIVRVGEVLSFTIRLNNNSAFSLTHVTMVDDYDHTVLAFSRAITAHDFYDPATGTITWTNVATPPIPPGQSLTFTVFFTVEHPKPRVVNAVRSQDITSSNGSISYTAETSRTGEAIGGAAPVFKSLHPADTVPIAGLPITFTHLITNDGAAMITYLPLTDTYNSEFLEFHFAIPTPTIISQAEGILVWTDLTTHFGNIPPFATVVITTVFTAATRIDNTFNAASTEGALDEYNNDLAPGSAQVPIRIIDAPAPEHGDDHTPTPYPAHTATPFPTATAISQTTTTTPGPLYLPETGGYSITKITLPILAAILLSWGGYAVVKYRQRRKQRVD